MSEPKKTKITIIGSGLAGSFLSVLLAQKGYKIEIFERLDKNDICDTASKRSYNIVLFGFGISLLKNAGLWEDIKPDLLTLQGTVTHIAQQEKSVTSLVDQQKMPYFTIARARFADILLKKASTYSSVTIHYNSALVSVDRHRKSIVIQDTKSKKISTTSYEVIIGADGANSLVRGFIQQGVDSHNSQEFASWTYKQFLLSPETVDKLQLKKGFVHVWTQKDAFIIMHPDSTDSLAAMLVYPKNEKNHNLLTSESGIKTYIQGNFPELAPAIGEIRSEILANPEGNFATVKTEPWYYKDFMALIGDAAHGFYPFFGQGTTAAFTDCMMLVQLLEDYEGDWQKILPLYQEKRKKHADTLGELSKEVIQKYLRFKKADYDAIYDKIEYEAHRFFPNIFSRPLSQSIITDPAHAADHMEKHLKQRKNMYKAGISLLIGGLTLTAVLYELNTKKKSRLEKNQIN
ncbi:MAG TPA: NAD(P)/FAD-dependent oxidoreductase [Candidatus Saccharimonadales bacterium]|nr:NAD(P)/FAD-dependent oxidoreductase [Candidatus Saccharimonadales bacterium]